MKTKRRLWACLLTAFVFLLVVTMLLYIPSGGEALAITKRIYAGGVIRQIEKDIQFTGEDVVTLYSNGSLAAFEIKSHASAEVLYDCIRNAKHLFDRTNFVCAPEFLPVCIKEGAYCNFSSLGYTHPATGRYVVFYFSEEDAAAFESYVMSVVEEKKAEDKILYYPG